MEAYSPMSTVLDDEPAPSRLQPPPTAIAVTTRSRGIRGGIIKAPRWRSIDVRRADRAAHARRAARRRRQTCPADSRRNVAVDAMGRKVTSRAQWAGRG